MEVTDQLHTPEENVPGNHWTGGWVSLGAAWTLCRKENLAPAGIQTTAVQPTI
jgi:hypothetical protein